MSTIQTETDPIETTSAPSDRDPSGRFAKGNTGAPGNPFGRQLAKFRKALTTESAHPGSYAKFDCSHRSASCSG